MSRTSEAGIASPRLRHSCGDVDSPNMITIGDVNSGFLVQYNHKAESRYSALSAHPEQAYPALSTTETVVVLPATFFF